MRRKKRTKKLYAELHDDPRTLFPGCEVILFPNGQPEIWIKADNGRFGITIEVSKGPVGMGVRIRKHVGTRHLTVWKDSPGKIEAEYLEMVQDDGSEYAAAHNEWYCNSKGTEYPGAREEFEAKAK